MNALPALFRSTCICLLSSLPQLAAQAPAAPATPSDVRVALPQPITADQPVDAPGRTEPIESARIFTRATGIVRERRFDIGDRVAAGDVMAVIDVPELDRALAAAAAQIELGKVRQALAELEAERATQLVASQALPIEEAQRRTAELQSAGAALRVAEAELARLQVLQGFATVTAPFPGVVAARNFDRGDRVRGDNAGAEGWLFELVRLDELRFVLPAAPELALRLDGAPLPSVRFREFPGRTFAAVAVRTSRVFDPATGTMRVELRLPNPELLLPAGLSGAAWFTLPPLPGGFLVPNNALQLRAGQPTLAIVRDGRIALLVVTTGRTRGLQVEVAHAELSPTTPVVVNPNALLRAGDAVRISEPVPSPAGAR
ncbi:MAG: efflux RND transporter periplasmic adaptor subunit [Planctomycetes bacterium]|jgi:RND family efflux transporter MFP subunit|nr:efflux RND transporter periplasmic adaptor subunit [Planctomycetota bacterium]